MIVPLLVCRMLECCCSEDGESGWQTFQVLVRSAEMCLGLFLSEDLHDDVSAHLSLGSSMIVEATDLLQQAALKVNSIDLGELADWDGQDVIARYHFLCAWMVRIIDLVKRLKTTDVYRH